MRTLTRSLLTLGSLVATASGLHADTHTFVPKPSAGTQPALRIKSGDRVITTTIDDKSLDAKGTLLAKGSNPRTGPFYIEGAEPGDMLVVSLDKLEARGTSGIST